MFTHKFFSLFYLRPNMVFFGHFVPSRSVTTYIRLSWRSERTSPMELTILRVEACQARRSCARSLGNFVQSFLQRSQPKIRRLNIGSPKNCFHFALSASYVIFTVRFAVFSSLYLTVEQPKRPNDFLSGKV